MSQPPPSTRPIAYLHTVTPPDAPAQKILTFKAENPWAHWMDLDVCNYTCVPLCAETDQYLTRRVAEVAAGIEADKGFEP
jgi:hypothetical protein